MSRTRLERDPNIICGVGELGRVLGKSRVTVGKWFRSGLLEKAVVGVVGRSVFFDRTKVMECISPDRYNRKAGRPMKPIIAESVKKLYNTNTINASRE